MRAKRIEVARNVATRLFAAEQAIDLAASRVAELSAIMPIARLDANVSAMIGQDAIKSSADALRLMAKARERIVTTHARLKEASDHIGLREVSFGDSIKPPTKAETLPTGGHLRIAS